MSMVQTDPDLTYIGEESGIHIGIVSLPRPTETSPETPVTRVTPDTKICNVMRLQQFPIFRGTFEALAGKIAYASMTGRQLLNPADPLLQQLVHELGNPYYGRLLRREFAAYVLNIRQQLNAQPSEGTAT